MLNHCRSTINSLGGGVYGLIDQRHPFKIQYVGATTRTFQVRLKEYQREKYCPGPKVREWLQKIGRDNLSMVVLEALPPGAELKKAEQQWIAWAKLFGPTLNLQLGDLNGKDGLNKEFVA